MFKKYWSKSIAVLLTLVMMVSLLPGMTTTAYAAVNQTLSGAQAGIKLPFTAVDIFGAEVTSALVYFGQISNEVQLYVGDANTSYNWGEGYDGTQQFYFYAATAGTYTFLAGTEGLPSGDGDYTITVNVTSSNTAPTFIGGANTGLTVNEDAGATTISSSMLEVKDAEQNAASLSYTVGTAPSKGQLKKNGVNVNGGGTFTQSDINSNLITFTPSANQNGSSNFTFSVSDGQGGSLAGQTFSITIFGINDSPTGLPTINGTVTENQLLTASVAGIADIDGLGAYSYQWQVSADGSSGWSNIIGATTSTYTLTSGEAGKYVRVRVGYTDGGGTSEVLYSSATTKVVALGKTLTADTTNNDVDYDIEVTFGSDAAFEGAITGVSFNGTALTVTTDYVVSSGKVTLKPSGGNAALQTPATANVVITATGYNSSTVSQQITAGTVTSLTVTTQPVPGAASGDTFATQPVVTLKDQYNNICVNGPSATANVVATAKAGTGTWTIGGTTTKAATAGVATFTDLTCTLTAPGNGVMTFTSTATVDSNIFNIPIYAGKALTADTTNNDVDHDIEVTFGSDAAFEGAITGVSFNGTDLTVTTDYVVSSGKVTMKPSGGNVALQTPATANVVITATGYNSSTVSQQITAGTVTSLTVTTQPVPGAVSEDTFATQPVVTLKDQYNNICVNGPSATANVVATAKAGTGTWTIGGTTTKAATAGVATFTNLTCTLTAQGNGAMTFTSTATVDSNTFNIPNNAGKALTADTTNNDVNHDIEVTFGSDAAFEGAITGVSFNGTDLTVTTDYVVSSGKVTMKPSGGNVALQTPATANVVITATGYNSSTVSQQITAGTVTSLTVTTQPVPGAVSEDTFATQPVVTLKDQYNNICVNGPSATANVVATAKAGTGTWTIGGTTTKTATAGVATFTNLTCTLTAQGNGAMTFTSTATVDSNTFNIPNNAGKALTADTTNNDVDHDIEVTFGSDAAFEGAITGVSFNGTDLTVTTDYVVSSGKVTLKPSGGNVALQTPATANVVITATGYNSSTVSQQIKHGAIVVISITQNITSPTSNGGNFALQPIITLKDTYGNTCTSDNATIVTAAKEDTGTWTLTGTTTASAISGVATFTNLGATNTALVNNAQLGFTATGLTRVTSATVNLPAPVVSGGGSSGSGSNVTTPPTNQEAVIVIVNGKEQDAGKETMTTEDGKSIVTVSVNNKVIESKIEEAVKNNTTGSENVIQVPVADTKSEVVKVELTGDIVKKLEENTFDVSVKRDNVEYVIPAEEFTISKVAENLGVLEKDLEDIKIEVQITKLDASVTEKYNEVAKTNGAELVFPPVAFEIVAKTTKADGTKANVEISKFSNYVERVMEIPAGVDPSKITTGIVFNPDGTYSHVPTEVFQKDGKWYAKLNSLTNSNYSVIWNPITVKSVEKHWSKDAVNDMASRLVVFNAETFAPNKAIIRSDFAEYIVRALGLYREGSTHASKFSDVKAEGDRTLAILIANEYGIVAGYPDGTFKPDALITREEAMAMYQRAMKVTKLVGTDADRYQSYTDYAKVSSWAATYVKEVLSAHVFNGNTATTISPKSNLTYAEAAQAIKNLLVESKLINK